MAEVNASGKTAVSVDFKDKSTIIVKGKVSKLDPTSDAFARIPPAPKGEYDLKLTPGRNGFEVDALDPKKPISNDNCYYKVNMEAVIVNNSDYENQRVFPTVTTRIGRGKELSTMADLIVRLGAGKHLKPEMNDFEVAELFSKILDKEPVFKKVPCDWEGYSKEDDRTVFKTMSDFPSDGKGGFVPVGVHNTKNRQREEINAQLKVKEWPVGAKPSNPNAPKGAAKGTIVKKAKPEPLPEPTPEIDTNGSADEETLDLLG